MRVSLTGTDRTLTDLAYRYEKLLKEREMVEARHKYLAPLIGQFGEFERLANQQLRAWDEEAAEALRILKIEVDAEAEQRLAECIIPEDEVYI